MIIKYIFISSGDCFNPLIRKCQENTNPQLATTYEFVLHCCNGEKVKNALEWLLAALGLLHQ